MCATWAEGTEGDTTGDSVQCRIYHAGGPAAGDPGLHCPHAGPDGGGVCVAADPPPVVNVSISGFAFVPANVTIAPGTTVIWTNLDNAPHTASTTDDGTFDSGTLTNGETYSFTFVGAGNHPYQCNIHPGMKGTITVE
jgi:hypothetical protein